MSKAKNKTNRIHIGWIEEVGVKSWESVGEIVFWDTKQVRFCQFND